jgi:tripartite-type tricarboxylate transporter receptor subunit TctC
MKSRFSAIASAATGCLAGLIATGASAQDAATFYKGRNFDIIVASPPGGGFDAYARIIARHIVKYMPGPPNFVIRNMPGAGARNATTYIADVAARDGTVMLANQPGALVEPILGDPKQVFYKPLDFQYIGSAEAFTSLCLMRTDSAVKSYAELHEKEAIFGGDQIGSTTHDHTVMFRKLSGAKIKMITGYKGTSDLVLAIQRKEIDGFCGYAWSSLFARSPDLVNKGATRIVNQIALTPHAAADKAGVPNALDFVKDPLNKKAMELIATVQEFGRPYLVHGAVPADRVAALRTAFDATMKDKDYVEEVEKARLEVSPRTGAQVQELLRRVLEAPKEVQERARWGITLE